MQRVSSKGGEEAFLTSSSSHGHWEELPEAAKEKAEKEKCWSGGVCECVRDAPNARACATRRISFFHRDLRVCTVGETQYSTRAAPSGLTRARHWRLRSSKEKRRL